MQFNYNSTTDDVTSYFSIADKSATLSRKVTRCHFKAEDMSTVHSTYV